MPQIELHSKTALWIVAAALFSLLLSANLAAPLYAVYGEELGFQSAVPALIFATYAFALDGEGIETGLDAAALIDAGQWLRRHGLELDSAQQRGRPPGVPVPAGSPEHGRHP